MDAYDLPEEFAHLQAQDMSKIGFINDVVRGIKKIAQADAPKTTVVKETVISGGNANTAPLLKRAFMFIEDGDWNSANEYCEKVLDIDPENAQAYLGKLLSELRVRKQETLKEQAEPFDHSNNYQKAIRFADEKQKTALAGYIEYINTRNENARLDEMYACQKRFEEIKAKQEAERLEKERKAEIARKEAEKRAKRNKKIAIITTPIVCVVIAYIIVLNAVIIPNSKVIKIKEKLKNANVGSYVTFGAYEQDNNNSNGKEDMEWLVLEVKDGKALVVSKYALDCKQYNTSNTDVTWETCTLRKWLNNDFINAAFFSYEKAMIPTVTVSADKNPNYNTNPGNATQDQVFLLSITEANKYFSSDSARQCEPTDFAVANGAWESDSSNCWWWLRSPGDDQYSAAYVNYDGDVYESGHLVYRGSYAVRPALWIDLNS